MNNTKQFLIEQIIALKNYTSVKDLYFYSKKLQEKDISTLIKIKNSLL